MLWIPVSIPHFFYLPHWLCRQDTETTWDIILCQHDFSQSWLQSIGNLFHCPQRPSLHSNHLQPATPSAWLLRIFLSCFHTVLFHALLEPEVIHYITGDRFFLDLELVLSSRNLKMIENSSFNLHNDRIQSVYSVRRLYEPICSC